MKSAFCIVVAAGKGLRMGADMPKQFLPIGGRPLLMHTLEAFSRAVPDLGLVLVLPADQQDFWLELCRRHGFTLPHTLVSGGRTRFHSVQNGLKAISDSGVVASDDALDSPVREPAAVGADTGTGTADVPLVAVHDGVRPFVSSEVIRRCFEAARDFGAAVPVVPVVETLRQVSEASSRTVDRSLFRLVQTPQTFRMDLLLRAYQQPYSDLFTDDASVVEALGHPVTLVEGNRENIKITTPFDLIMAETLSAREQL